MKKSDLKSGMGVELNNGGLYMVVIGEEFSALTGDGYMNLDGYNEDLTYPKSVSFDVKKVFNPEYTYSMQPKHFISDFYGWFNLVWERQEDKYKDLEIGDICEVWDSTDEDDKVLAYYIGDKEFVSSKSYLDSDDEFYREYYDHFKLIKKASDID